MASQTFRDSIGSLGWARRERDAPVNTSQQSGLLSSLQSLNPFGDRGYVQLPTTEGQGAPLPAPSRREEEEGWFVPPRVRTEAALYGRLLRLDRPDAVLFARSPKHDPHPLLSHRPAGRAGVVPGQLLPDGVERPAPGDQLWGPEGGGLDDGLMMAVAQLVERD
ncbi:uncharacterized protein E0L32_003094 [Thyridium curvatum]|uniref:Uncharacterized protein n=1 Tax=Thyridium curvatum TaxID=1093900 RepID=A0A507BK41_9PEZI|nr:uncharacterized protein E0L32_003094 [Thyridium curvatum]TPX17451.1 hypothetical protein E0L32_003094 [Thyridium curvatum]